MLKIVFIFYEANEAGLTTDHLLYHGDSLAETYRLWKEERKGALAEFPFGYVNLHLGLGCLSLTSP